MKFGHLEGVPQPYLGFLLTMVINHVTSHWEPILQVFRKVLSKIVGDVVEIDRMHRQIGAHRGAFFSKNFPTDPWSIPQTPNQQFMKEFLSFGGLGMSGVCSRGMLGFP